MATNFHTDSDSIVVFEDEYLRFSSVDKNSRNSSPSCKMFKSVSDVYKGMKSIGDIEEDLARKAEPVLGFKPSSKFKRGPIGILIYVVCCAIAFLSLRSAGIL